ncbi:LysE family translocator [Paraburkholderia graminis]|uniref:Homoserine/homoserine lactone efflux protein n=1 Tax=Paraburkholderia graminis TaxID=60548 RepID=A0ABD5CT09_9BURK|nr:LysE family translocator [Paraburkholderia graminis]MDR6208284.1 homoserine/homoserine lactone efflux protein [Paraburkholderia graminis]
MSFHTWVLFATAYLVTTISPGPNVLLVIRNTVRYGSRGAASTIAGNLLAQLVVVVLVALGVGAVLAAMPPLFVGMKVVGAVYLMYLGLKQLRSQAPKATPSANAQFAHVLNKGKIFREAILVSGSNPKTLIFLSAFMPQFITHDRPLPEQFIVMYLTVAAIVALVHTIYSVSVRGIHNGLGSNRWVGAVKRSSGVVFIALGIKLLTAKRA